MPIINDDLELDRILDNTNVDEYMHELTDMPMEQPDESPQELTGVGTAPTSDTQSTSGLAPCNESSGVLRSRVDPCLGSYFACLLIHVHHHEQATPTHTINTTRLCFVSRSRCHVLHYVTVSMVTMTRKVPGRPR